MSAHGELLEAADPSDEARPDPDTGACKRCRGTGVEHYQDGGTITCSRCEGAGDLDGYRLTGAWQQGYQRGREDALRSIRQAAECLELGLRWLEDGAAIPPPDVIRARLGG